MAELWERQPWDTEVSYARFIEYYLPQENPRSLNEAYRLFKSQRSGKPVSPNARAPGYWAYWYRGDDSQGNARPGTVNWQQRAQAWDEMQAQRALKELEDRQEAKRETLRRLADAALEKIGRVLIDFDPGRVKDDVKLSELVHAIKIVSEENRKAYMLDQVQEHRHEIVDWRARVLELIESGQLSFEEVKDEVGDELAAELFTTSRAVAASTRPPTDQDNSQTTNLA